MEQNGLAAEWSLLQNQSEHYERCSLLIKLSGVALLSAALLLGAISPVICALIAVLWLQDGIWKTFQSRLEDRLLELEQAMRRADPEPACAFQLHSHFAQNRPGGAGLIVAYVRQALRPTVAYPHAVLLLIALLCQ